MADKLAKFFIGIFGGIASVWWGKYLIMFIISLMPILELRGGLIAASLMNAPILPSFLVCLVGNILPIPFILWFITSIFAFIKKKSKKLGKIITKLEEKANSKKEQIERLKYLGLVLFVGIPLPGTGAWTGCLIAALLGMDKKKSFYAAVLGVFIAGIIMLIFSYGILGGILR
ncbi:MAG: small multi-drug export protein [Ruminococcus sp.]|nr:small multi-drug export protein [Ruminococcus sp.]